MVKVEGTFRFYEEGKFVGKREINSVDPGLYIEKAYEWTLDKINRRSVTFNGRRIDEYTAYRLFG